MFRNAIVKFCVLNNSKQALNHDIKLLTSKQLTFCQKSSIFSICRTRSKLTNVCPRKSNHILSMIPCRNLAKIKITNSGGEKPKTYLWILVISSICVGVIMLSIVGYSKVRRRLRGVEDLREDGVYKNKNFIRYKGVVLPKFTEEILEKLQNFEVRPDDVWVVSFPRSGTTFAQEITFLINSNMDKEKALSMSIDERFPYLEYLTPGVDAVHNQPSPRHIKTHLPLKLLPKDITKAKVIYVARNPKDLAVSYFHFYVLLRQYKKTLEDFVGLFVNNKVGYGPWWEHVLEFWKIRDNPNILFLMYEDMVEDLEGTIRKISSFLGKPVSDQDVAYLMKHCQFDNMKKNEQTNYEWMQHLGVWDNSDPQNRFMRKGKVGEWRNHFNQELNYKVNRMVVHKLDGSGLHFKYDIGEDAERLREASQNQNNKTGDSNDADQTGS